MVLFMEINKLLPFERNRYYVGKLLTSADFQAEQAYGDHKRRFLNGMMFGRGIVCGLSVYSLDDLSIMVDSGVAVDGGGHEIVVDSPIVRKLSAVDGFEGLESDRALLCLRYQEESVHPVYTVQGQENGESYECNRIREGWSLFLQDSGKAPAAAGPELEFLTSAVLYRDEDWEVVCTMPAKSPCGASVRLDITARRRSESAGPMTLRTAIQTPAFTAEDGGHELVLEWRDICPDKEQTMHRHLTAQQTPAEGSVLLADSQSIHVTVDGTERTAAEDFSLRAGVTELTAAGIVDQAVASASLEMRETAEDQGFVPLAEIALQRTRSAYLIEEVRTENVRRYIRTAADSALRQELGEWFRAPAAAAAPPVEKRQAPEPAERTQDQICATGVCEIPLGVDMRRGQVAYSDEIVHGLGPGTVFVSVGTEYLADDPKLGTAARNTIYGDSTLFPQEQAPAVAAETAVKVMDDRGSFVVAARLTRDTTQVVLPLRWVAVLLPGGEENKLQKLAGKSIAAMQPTVVMGTRESHYFNVRFNNMEPCTLTYELMERDSGEITPDGIYTAPGREGVYEIRISCAEQPLISTYAYAVVKKKNALEEEEGQ